MPETTYTPGRQVVFTTGPLGLVRGPHDTRFVEQTVDAGDVGSYVGKHPTLADWHLVLVGEYLAPVHPSQIAPWRPTPEETP